MIESLLGAGEHLFGKRAGLDEHVGGPGPAAEAADREGAGFGDGRAGDRDAGPVREAGIDDGGALADIEAQGMRDALDGGFEIPRGEPVGENGKEAAVALEPGRNRGS